MNRALASGPIVWLGIIVTTCLLLVLFQTVLWLVMPVLLAVVAYYLMSPLVNVAIARGLTRSRAVLIVTVLMSVVLVGVGASVEPERVARVAERLAAHLVPSPEGLLVLAKDGPTPAGFPRREGVARRRPLA